MVPVANALNRLREPGYISGLKIVFSRARQALTEGFRLTPQIEAQRLLFFLHLKPGRSERHQRDTEHKSHDEPQAEDSHKEFPVFFLAVRLWGM